MTALPEQRREAPQRWGLVLRIAVTASVFAYLFSRVDLIEVTASLSQIPFGAAVASALAMSGAVATGIMRWRALLDAYGVQRLPSWSLLTRWYLVAMFYNLLPGAVGGDVLRGVATRDCFPAGAVTTSVSVVFVERVLGLSGLFLLSGLAAISSASFHPEVLLYTVGGLAIAAGAIATIAIGRRLAPRLPSRLREIARVLPTIERWGPFLRVILISVLSHVAVSLAGHALIHSLAPDVTLAQSMVIFPLGALAAYFPLTIAGAGARDAALVVLFAQIGVPRNDALATSLFLLVAQLAISALGGLIQLREPMFPATRPLQPSERNDP